MKKITNNIRNLKNNRVVSMMTAYDYPSAKAVSEAEIDIILVGDSLAQVVLGHDDTLSITVDEMLHHVKAVTNAKPSPLVVADMPYMSYDNIIVGEDNGIQGGIVPVAADMSYSAPSCDSTSITVVSSGMLSGDYIWSSYEHIFLEKALKFF